MYLSSYKIDASTRPIVYTVTVHGILLYGVC